MPITLGWNRESDEVKIRNNKIQLDNGEVELYSFNIEAGFGAGMKNIIPLIK